MYVKIDTKTAPTYFGAVTPSSGGALLVLAKVTLVKIHHQQGAHYLCLLKLHLSKYTINRGRITCAC